MRRIHLLLSIQTLVIVLLTVNRLSSLTTGYVAQNEFLRWIDFHNMLSLPLFSLVAFYLLKKVIEYDSPQRNGFWHNLLSLFFVVGVYLLGAGYGEHEVTNYLHVRFCSSEADASSVLCRIVIFNDDEFSHWVWFAGFVLMNAMILCLQAIFPARNILTNADLLFLAINGLFIGLGVFANLAFEEIGLDLYIVALLAILAVGLWWRKGRQPLFVYYSVAYLFGLVATGLYKLLS